MPLGVRNTVLLQSKLSRLPFGNLRWLERLEGASRTFPETTDLSGEGDGPVERETMAPDTDKEADEVRDDGFLLIGHEHAPYEAYNGLPKPASSDYEQDFEIIDYQEACHSSINGHAGDERLYDFVHDPTWQNKQRLLEVKRRLRVSIRGLIHSRANAELK